MNCQGSLFDHRYDVGNVIILQVHVNSSSCPIFSAWICFESSRRSYTKVERYFAKLYVVYVYIIERLNSWVKHKNYLSNMLRQIVPWMCQVNETKRYCNKKEQRWNYQYLNNNIFPLGDRYLIINVLTTITIIDKLRASIDTKRKEGNMTRHQSTIASSRDNNVCQDNCFRGEFRKAIDENARHFGVLPLSPSESSFSRYPKTIIAPGARFLPSVSCREIYKFIAQRGTLNNSKRETISRID